MTKAKATWTGIGAVALWSLLALLTVWSKPIPPLQLNAMCFVIGGTVGLVWTSRSGGLKVLRNVPLKVYVFGTLGLFGYHFLYFSALRAAPPAQAGLIAYLWPLLIVLFSGLLPGETLRKGHVIGALLGFAGAGLIVLRGEGDGIETTFLFGYAIALLCAVTWSGYSVLSRRLGKIPTASVTVFCLATAVFSVVAHLAFETTVIPDTPTMWLAVLGLGLGPVGLAFFVWDIGVKQGDIQLLGVASYAAPLLSTLALIAAGAAQASVILILASALIAGGALVAARTSRAQR